MAEELLRAAGLRRIYQLGGREIRALDGVDLRLERGEYLRIVGPSGSGKSTLLNLLAGLDRPSDGTIAFSSAGLLSEMSPAALAAYRAREVGVVFQSFNLITHRTALQNVELGLLFLGVPREERLRRARAMLDRLALGARCDHRPGDLSGGEQQRVALARALVKEPALLLADEPTGNLDREISGEIAGLLRELNRRGLTIVLVTHDIALARGDVDRTVHMDYGRIVSEERPESHGAPGRRT
ncbi:MAG: ATP-binding cassette domain-containing protein [Candidatus Eisenbacteria bacterium]|nr:ATP-binding cassette domain-containing protein [Candidatus Eisenbacteria bacterium]